MQRSPPFHHPKKKPHTIKQSLPMLPLPFPCPWQPDNQTFWQPDFLSLWIFLFWEFHINVTCNLWSTSCCRMLSHSFDVFSLMVNDVDHLFMYLLLIYVSSNFLWCFSFQSISFAVLLWSLFPILYAFWSYYKWNYFLNCIFWIIHCSCVGIQLILYIDLTVCNLAEFIY